MHNIDNWQELLRQKEDEIIVLKDKLDTFKEKEKTQESVFAEVYQLYKVIKEQKKELEELHKEVLQKNKEIKQQAEELYTQNETLLVTMAKLTEKEKHILQSINYAQRIQEAMLPFLERIEQSLDKENFFILYKPRNIVSGDFYFFEQIGHKIVIIAADCTGHGVPGALMSMIGINILEEIIISLKITQPDIILNQLHKKIQYALKQQETQNKDGMDIAVCVIDKTKKTIEYAGANNSIYVIQEGVLQDHKADKFAIGGHQTEIERIFTKHSIDISKPTMLYLFSDGYQDQFGGIENRKFMKKRFRELLSSIYTKPLDLQKIILDDTLKDWQMNTYEQTDDILVMGIKL
ncbi:MAG: hypothetical protein EAZ85_01940 [Bacteroidetes bacterium]|nr:MAG: hypothetical protein EAZ85_01940 [Bacteroidota bacterium]